VGAVPALFSVFVLASATEKRAQKRKEKRARKKQKHERKKSANLTIKETYQDLKKKIATIKATDPILKNSTLQ
jgi:hypothetical protein